MLVTVAINTDLAQVGGEILRLFLSREFELKNITLDVFLLAFNYRVLLHLFSSGR